MTQLRKDALAIANRYEVIIYGQVSRDIARFRVSIKCAIAECNQILKLDVWDWPHNAEHGKIHWEELREELITML